MNLKILGAALVSILVLSGCRSEPLQNIENVAFAVPTSTAAQGLTLDDYKAAIVRAGAQRGWVFSDQGTGEMIGSVVVRGKHSAKIRVLYNESAFSIVYIDSAQLNYDAERKEIHPNYNHWVRNLRNDIQKQIALAKVN